MNNPITSFLEYESYIVGFGKDGKISRAIYVRSKDVADVVAKLNKQGYNVYIRPNADFFTHEPARIRDIDIVNPTIYVIDIDEKDNPGADIESILTQFTTDHSLTNFLLQFTGHGCQLWVRCDPVETVPEYKAIASRLKAFIEAQTSLTVDFTPNPSRYGRFPDTINYNKPIRKGRVISWKTGMPFDISKCPEMPCKSQRNGRSAIISGDHTTNTTPSGHVFSKTHTPAGREPPEERADLVAFGFIHSERKRNDVLQVLQNPHPDHRDRLWLVGFLKYCKLSRSRTVALIHRYNQWSDYNRTHTRYQIKSVWRSAGRRSRS